MKKLPLILLLLTLAVHVINKNGWPYLPTTDLQYEFYWINDSLVHLLFSLTVFSFAFCLSRYEKVVGKFSAIEGVRAIKVTSFIYVAFCAYDLVDEIITGNQSSPLIEAICLIACLTVGLNQIINGTD